MRSTSARVTGGGAGAVRGKPLRSVSSLVVVTGTGTAAYTAEGCFLSAGWESAVSVRRSVSAGRTLKLETGRFHGSSSRRSTGSQRAYTSRALTLPLSSARSSSTASSSSEAEKRVSVIRRTPFGFPNQRTTFPLAVFGRQTRSTFAEAVEPECAVRRAHVSSCCFSSASRRMLCSSSSSALESRSPSTSVRSSRPTLPR